MNLISATLLSLTASALLATSAFAQCPDNVVPASGDPLIGQWAFHWEAGDYSPVGSAAIGTFEVTRGAQGYMAVTGNMTLNAGGTVVRMTATGTRSRGVAAMAQYQCDASGLITGGTLQLSDGSQGTLWRFIFKDRTQQGERPELRGK